MPSNQTDLLDYVIDNTATSRREVYRDGVLRLVCPKDCLDHTWLRAFNALGEWGTFPAAAPGLEHAHG